MTQCVPPAPQERRVLKRLNTVVIQVTDGAPTFEGHACAREPRLPRSRHQRDTFDVADQMLSARAYVRARQLHKATELCKHEGMFLLTKGTERLLRYHICQPQLLSRCSSGYELLTVDGLKVRRRCKPAPAVPQQEPGQDQQPAAQPAQECASYVAHEAPLTEPVITTGFANPEHLSHALQRQCSEYASNGGQAHLTAMCEAVFKQAADHVQPESAAAAQVFHAMSLQCRQAIANAYAHFAPSADASTSQKGMQALVDAEKARVRAAIAHKKAQHDHLLKLQQQLSDQRAALDLLQRQRARSGVLSEADEAVAPASSLHGRDVMVPLQDGSLVLTCDKPAERPALALLVRSAQCNLLCGCHSLPQRSLSAAAS
jgi:hypothetical protein